MKMRLSVPSKAQAYFYSQNKLEELEHEMFLRTIHL